MAPRHLRRPRWLPGAEAARDAISQVLLWHERSSTQDCPPWAGYALPARPSPGHHARCTPGLRSMVYTELLTSRLDDACPNVFKCIITPPPSPKSSKVIRSCDPASIALLPNDWMCYCLRYVIQRSLLFVANRPHSR